MVFLNYSTMQMVAKIVYYGPGLCGKTTNLKEIYRKTSSKSRGEMVSLETETDRTLFFDLLPMDVGVIGGFKTKFQLYTVPGQVFYNSTRKLVLRGVDGIVFVADSQRPMLDANQDSLDNLQENLEELGLSIDDVPMVFQFNKRDLPNVIPVDELNETLNYLGKPYVEASALQGDGVFETLKEISKQTLLKLRTKAMGQDKKPEKPKLQVRGAENKSKIKEEIEATTDHGRDVDESTNANFRPPPEGAAAPDSGPEMGEDSIPRTPSFDTYEQAEEPINENPLNLEEREEDDTLEADDRLENTLDNIELDLPDDELTDDSLDLDELDNVSDSLDEVVLDDPDTSGLDMDEELDFSEDEGDSLDVMSATDVPAMDFAAVSSDDDQPEPTLDLDDEPAAFEAPPTAPEPEPVAEAPESEPEPVAPEPTPEPEPVAPEPTPEPEREAAAEEPAPQPEPEPVAEEPKPEKKPAPKPKKKDASALDALDALSTSVRKTGRVGKKKSVNNLLTDLVDSPKKKAKMEKVKFSAPEAFSKAQLNCVLVDDNDNVVHSHLVKLEPVEVAPGKFQLKVTLDIELDS